MTTVFQKEVFEMTWTTANMTRRKSYGDCRNEVEISRARSQGPMSAELFLETLRNSPPLTPRVMIFCQLPAQNA